MGAAADEVNPIDIFEAVVRAQMQHLVEAVREVKSRPLVNLILRVPIVGSNDALETDPLLHILEAGFLNLAECFCAKTLALL